VQLDLPAVRREAGALRGEVIHVDHFGNLITNVFGDYATEPRPEACCVEIGGARIRGVRRGYFEAGAGELCAVVGSAACSRSRCVTDRRPHAWASAAAPRCA